MGARPVILLVVCILFSIVMVGATQASADDFDHEVAEALSLVNKAYKLGGNVTSYVEELNRAVRMYERGDADDAYQVVDSVKDRLLAEMPGLEEHYNSVLLRRDIIVATLLVIPLISYFLIPYSYYELWYRLRRDWIIEEVGEGAGES